MTLNSKQGLTTEHPIYHQSRKQNMSLWTIICFISVLKYISFQNISPKNWVMWIIFYYSLSLETGCRALTEMYFSMCLPSKWISMSDLFIATGFNQYIFRNGRRGISAILSSRNRKPNLEILANNLWKKSFVIFNMKNVPSNELEIPKWEIPKFHMRSPGYI